MGGRENGAFEARSLFEDSLAKEVLGSDSLSIKVVCHAISGDKHKVPKFFTRNRLTLTLVHALIVDQNPLANEGIGLSRSSHRLLQNLLIS